MATAGAAPLVALHHYRPQDFEATVRLWYEVGRAAHPYVSERFSHADYRAYFNDVMSVGSAIWLAETAERLAGVIILRGDFVDQLYVAVAHQRQGIGGVLMARARRTRRRGCGCAASSGTPTRAPSTNDSVSAPSISA